MGSDHNGRGQLQEERSDHRWKGVITGGEEPKREGLQWRRAIRGGGKQSEVGGAISGGQNSLLC